MSLTTIGALVAFILGIIGIINLDSVDLVDPLSDALIGITAFSGCALVDTWRTR